LDQIHIRELKFRCIIGVNEDERHEKQDVAVNITLWADLSRACRTDRIEDTVDYKTLKRQILAVAEQSEFNLIEALAQRIADLCLQDRRVRQVRVSVEKPAALRFAKTVAVEITRVRTSTAFIAVGSNVEPFVNIPAALHLLQTQVHVTACSTFYQTEPLGCGKDQPSFVNGVWQIETTLTPLDMKYDVLWRIEDRLGRAWTQDKFSGRTIDLDLILYEDLVSTRPELVLPHPDLARPFVWTPVKELLDRDPELKPRLMPLLPGPPEGPAGQRLEDLTQRLGRALANPPAMVE
jgi:dihydroneopterin aldolase/2-amino-4-hydroxy-6-hydroxymethyldihydropteridine diphosphokinase